MSRLYRRAVLPAVAAATRRDAEVALHLHLRAMAALQANPAVLRLAARRHAGPTDSLFASLLGQDLLDGMHVPHPFGVAAGYDKNAAVYPAFEAHFSPGFVEVGTVTLRPQAGNPRPRVHRLPGGHLVNAMGFPNGGADAAAANLRRLPAPSVPLGVNVGKLKDTPDDAAAAEYGELVRRFGDLGERAPSYYVVNVSSPNTPGLRSLQEGGRLATILDAVTAALDQQAPESRPDQAPEARHDQARDARPDQARQAPLPRPRRRLLVKLAPELGPAGLEAVAALVERYDTGGLVLTNTRAATDRPGGVSGPDLFAASSAMVRAAAGLLPADRVIVATGGVDTVERAWQVLRYADLVGVYTGLVFRGPGLLRELRDGIAARMRAEGVTSLAELRAGQRPPARTVPA